MIARSGNIQIVPIIPVNVVRWVSGGCGLASGGRELDGTVARRFEGTGIMEGSDTSEKRAIVTYAHPRTQGSDCQVARAARGLSVPQRGGRNHLRGQGAGASGPCS